MAAEVRRIDGATVRGDFNALEAVLHYTRAAHRLGLWESERQLIARFFPKKRAALLEAGCGAGRATVALWDLGYHNLTAFDFAEELVEQARDLAQQRGAGRIRFAHADATKPSQLRALLPVGRSAQTVGCDLGRTARAAMDPMDEYGPDGQDATGTPPAPAHHRPPTTAHRPQITAHRPLFTGALFLFNGLMQIPTRRARRAALRNIAAVLTPGAPFLFTTHDRDEPDELHLWAEEEKLWAKGKQDPRLHDYGDRYFEHEHGRTFMHLPTRDEMLAEIAATGWLHEYDVMRDDLVHEPRAVKNFSDNCRFWLVRKPG